MIRGEASEGMLCSERELLISDEHDGIIEVSGDWPVGTPAAKALGLDDPMIYVKVTPNRPDALGIHGIARDLAAKGLGKLKPLDATQVEGSFDRPSRCRSISRWRHEALPAVRRPLFQGREQRPFARMAAAPPARPSACAPFRRWSTSPTTSPSPMAARCMCSMPTR